MSQPVSTGIVEEAFRPAVEAVGAEFPWSSTVLLPDQEHRVDDGEDGRGSADPEGKGEHRRRGESRCRP